MKKTIFINILLSFILVTATFGAGFHYGKYKYEENFDSNLESIIQEYEIIQKYYLNRDDLDYSQIVADVCEYMLYLIGDRHSYFYTPESYEEEEEKMSGQYYGVGITVGYVNGEYVIYEVRDDTPASKAGLQVGDIIKSVDGIPISDIESLSSYIKNEYGLEITMHISRQYMELDVTLVGDYIYQPCVSYEIIDDVVYMYVKTWNDSTFRGVKEAVEYAEEQNAKGIIIDLRNNLGGLLNSLLQCGSIFLDEDEVIMRCVDYEKETTYVAGNVGIHTDLPIVVLINHYSASASEAFTGALQDNNRAIVAGVDSYGKGTVNRSFELENGYAIYISIGEWMTPNGNNIEQNGISPDYYLDDDTDWVQWAIDKINEMGE